MLRPEAEPFLLTTWREKLSQLHELSRPGLLVVEVAGEVVLLPRSVLDAGGIDVGGETSELCVKLTSRR